MIQIIMISIAAAILAALISTTVACYQVTRTFDVFHFVCDYRYWCLAIINYRYRRAKQSGISDEDFARCFVRDYLMRGSFRRIHPMPVEIKVLILKLLENFNFVRDNMGMESYSFCTHNNMLAQFEEQTNMKA